MDLPKEGLDPDTLELIARTLDAAWEEVAVVNNDANSTALPRGRFTVREVKCDRG
jgi:hypothetical protein